MAADVRRIALRRRDMSRFNGDGEVTSWAGFRLGCSVACDFVRVGGDEMVAVKIVVELAAKILGDGGRYRKYIARNQSGLACRLFPTSSIVEKMRGGGDMATTFMETINGIRIRRFARALGQQTLFFCGTWAGVRGGSGTGGVKAGSWAGILRGQAGGTEGAGRAGRVVTEQALGRNGGHFARTTLRAFQSVHIRRVSHLQGRPWRMAWQRAGAYLCAVHGFSCKRHASSASAASGGIAHVDARNSYSDIDALCCRVAVIVMVTSDVGVVKR